MNMPKEKKKMSLKNTKDVSGDANKSSKTTSKKLDNSQAISIPTCTGNVIDCTVDHKIDKPMATEQSASDDSVVIDTTCEVNLVDCMSDFYRAMMISVKYLTLKDWLQVMKVNKFFRSAVTDPTLWMSVRLNGVRIRDWDAFGKILQEYGTRHLDVSGMIFPEPDDDTNTWEKFLAMIAKLPELDQVIVKNCQPSVLESIVQAKPEIKKLQGSQVGPGNVDLEMYSKLDALRELQIMGMPKTITLLKDITCYENFKKLTQLSLTGLTNLNGNVLDIVGDMIELKVLELGHCKNLPIYFKPSTLSRLKKLTRLRLETVPCEDEEYGILLVISRLESLKTLELIHIHCGCLGFAKALAQCKNIKQLLLIPIYNIRSLTTSQVIKGVKELKNTLNGFVFVITFEMLEDTLETLNYGSLNFGKPSEPGDYLITLVSPDYTCLVQEVTGFGVISREIMVDVLQNLMPDTKSMIVKIPFANVWYQTFAQYY